MAAPAARRWPAHRSSPRLRPRKKPARVPNPATTAVASRRRARSNRNDARRPAPATLLSTHDIVRQPVSALRHHAAALSMPIMALEDQHRAIEAPGRWLGRLKRARLVLAAAAVVFIALTITGVASLLQATVGFLIVAAASLIDFTTAHDHAAQLPSPDAHPLPPHSPTHAA